MTDDERRGREWCDEHAHEPEWYDPLSKWYWQLQPDIVGSINNEWFDTEADAYAAVGRAIAEMEAVVGIPGSSDTAR